MHDVDAVHLITAIPLHAEQTIAVHRSRKHCAFPVPMATSLESLQRIIDTQRETGKMDMVMEIAVLDDAIPKLRLS